MKSVFYVITISLLINTVSSDDTVKSKMDEHKVVPDVIDAEPGEILSVKYNDKIVNLGNELTPLQVKDTPSVSWKFDPDSYYTLAMVDPDAPSRIDPKYREVLHWLVGNIHGSDVKNGDHIAEYVGSGPPKGTSLHRYIFLLYKQEAKLKFDEPHTASDSRANRLNFSIRKFVKKYNLGKPVAGNLYQAEWDEYVEIRNKGIKN